MVNDDRTSHGPDASTGDGESGEVPDSSVVTPRRSSEVPSLDATARRARPTQSRTTTVNSIKPLSRRNSQDSQERRARPSIAVRRLSSTRVPHKGQGFSVDDASQEVEDFVAQSRPKQAQHASGSAKAAGGTVRRRAAAASRLPVVEASEYEDSPEPWTEAPLIESPVKTRQDGEEFTDAMSVDDVVIQDDESTSLAEEEDEDALSDAESFTLKDRQDAINETHPFGIRIWKPALYKKSRSVEKGAEGDIHSTPGGYVTGFLKLFNILWTLLFGWWLALLAAAGGLVCHLFAFAPGCKNYGRVLWGLSHYLFYPFGKYVKIVLEEQYVHEDEGEGRSISEYEQWQSGDIEEGRLFFGPVRSLVGQQRREADSEDDEESTSLLGRARREQRNASQAQSKPKQRFFGRGKWNLGRIIYFCFFYGLLAPSLLLVSALCWFMVFSVPMGRVTYILFNQLRRRPLALKFHADATFTRKPGQKPSTILLCTYKAVGLKYWKYTIDGTNIFLINLLAVVAFVIFDYWVLRVALDLHNALTNNIFIFGLAIFSIMPLAYFIGQAVASISAQSSMGVGAAVNAFFSTLVEVFLYCVALSDGKAQLVEGSIIGSIFAGILLLPGISMCFGAIKRKTQRFNVRSAGVTSTMLLFAMIGAFSPTLFYQIYGAHELSCHQCLDVDGNPLDRDCRRCFFAQIPAVNDPFYINAVRPYIWFAALTLFLSYIIGLLFTLRTHAATIWNVEIDEKKAKMQDSQMLNRSLSHSVHDARKASMVDYGGTTLSRQTTGGGRAVDIKNSPLYQQILGQTQKYADLQTRADSAKQSIESGSTAAQAGAQPSETKTTDFAKQPDPKNVPGLSEEQNRILTNQMVEMVAAATTVATHDVTMRAHRSQRSNSSSKRKPSYSQPQQLNVQIPVILAPEAAEAVAADATGGGHDAPNWSRTKSYAILLTATFAYAVIAEILVRTVDAVLAHVDIDEKFLGITIFALVPNTTEFLNAISFAMNGNIALSMEIGSAYALQVCLLQIPALVLFSAVNGRFIDASDVIDHTFSLIFPQWDMVVVILCVFLLSYMYGEGKSNYFKGSILILSYLVVLVGFYFSGFTPADILNPNDPDLGDGRMKPSAKSVKQMRVMFNKGTVFT